MKIKTLLGALSLTWLVAGGTAFAETVTLRFSTLLPPQHWLNKTQYQPWFDEIDKATEGRVHVEFLPKMAGTPLTQYEVVRDGLADIALIVPAYSPGRFVLADMGELPFLGNNAEIMAPIFERIYLKHFSPLNEYEGVKVLSTYNVSPIQLFNTKRPVRSVKDFEGLKLRVPSTISTREVELLGGVSIVKSINEAYEMLSTGVIDGHFGVIDAIKPMNLTDLFKYATIVDGGFTNSVHVIGVNPDSWAKISPEDQKAIEAITVGKLSASIGKGFYTAGEQAKKELLAANYEIDVASPEFMADLKDKLKPIEQDWIARAQAKGATDPAAVLAEFRAEIAAATPAAN